MIMVMVMVMVMVLRAHHRAATSCHTAQPPPDPSAVLLRVLRLQPSMLQRTSDVGYGGSCLVPGTGRPLQIVAPQVVSRSFQPRSFELRHCLRHGRSAGDAGSLEDLRSFRLPSSPRQGRRSADRRPTGRSNHGRSNCATVYATVVQLEMQGRWKIYGRSGSHRRPDKVVTLQIVAPQVVAPQIVAPQVVPTQVKVKVFPT